MISNKSSQTNTYKFYLILIATFCLMFCSTPTLGAAKKVITKSEFIVNGIISLPKGDTAPKGGITIGVKASSDNGTPNNYKDDYVNNDFVSILSGGSSAKYSIPVKKGKSYKVSYFICSNTSVYVLNGYRDAYGTAYDYNKAKLISSSNASEVNLVLIKGKSIENIIIPQKGEPILEHDASDLDKAVLKKAKEIINSVTKPGMTDFEKELALHDYVVLNTKYDNDNYLHGTISGFSYSSYGVLIKGIGVCEGYAVTMNLLLNMVGIETRVVQGTANNGVEKNGGHEWNIVKIEDEYYNLDATWDDPVTDIAGYVSHNYFNISDNELSMDHHWDIKTTPKCNSITYNYDYYTYCKNNGLPLKNSVQKIRGNIILPSGMLAPKGGISILIGATTDNNSNETSSYDFNKTTYVTIPAGRSSVGFSIIVPKNNYGYMLDYTLYTKFDGCLDNGYFRTEGTNYFKSNQSRVTSSNSSDISFYIIKGQAITGTISLPSGDIAPNTGVEIAVMASTDNGTPSDNTDNFNTRTILKIPGGKSSVSYKLTVAKSNALYSVEVSVDSSNSDYLDKGYYSSIGTTMDSKEQTLIDPSNTAPINISILRGNRIDGTVSLPKGDIAANGGYYVRVNAVNVSNSDLSFSTNITIPDGRNSAPFSLKVDPSKAIYKVSYNMNEKRNDVLTKYRIYGYYSVDGTTTIESYGTPINVPNNEQINLVILKCVTIQGYVSLPIGEVAPKGGIKLWIGSETNMYSDTGSSNSSNNYSLSENTDVVIPEGSNSAPYILRILASNNGYSLWYSLKSNYADYSSIGYYYNGGMIKGLSESNLINITDSITINLVIQK